MLGVFFKCLIPFFFTPLSKTVKTYSDLDLDPKDTFTMTLLFIGYDIIILSA